jgi:uncharacterized protein YkwD
MFFALLASFAILLAGPETLPPKATLKPAHAKLRAQADSGSGYGTSPSYDADAERVLLDLANQARAQAGLKSLHVDPGMTQAAREHAAAMARERQLSHQLDGEPNLSQRLAATSDIRLDQIGENVALDGTVEGAEQHLLQSPPHRENLLNPAYNVAGFAVVREGTRLYVVQDFGHSVPSYSPDQSEDVVANAVEQARRQLNLPPLQRVPGPLVQSAACSMAQENRLSTRATHDLADRFSVLSYTNAQPQVLPASANRFVGDRNLRNFSVGTCFARTKTYPEGVYWVTLIFY